MVVSDTHELFDRVPRWWSESVLGVAVAFAGVLGMSLSSLVVERVAVLLYGLTGSPGTVLEAAFAFAVSLLVLAIANAAIGLGVTYAYLTYRDLDPGFVVAWPDREAARWIAGLTVLAPALVWASTLLMGVLGFTGPDSGWNVPGSFVAARPFGSVAALGDLPLLVGGALTSAVIAGVIGPAVGALFHGVLQNSLRRVAPTAVAVGGTALAAAVLANGVDPVGTVVVVVVAVAAGYAYERTGTLAVPMATYAVLNAVTLATALVLILSASGRI